MKEPDPRQMKKNAMSIARIFLITLLFFGLITTIQMFILQAYLEYETIALKHYIMIASFWILCSVGFTYITYRQITNWYDKPMKRFAKATNRVANGDFSVYVEPLHSGDQMDYLDYMFIDFNKMVEELGSIETLKTDFISNVTHEIKTPIAIIHNYAEYLQKTDMTEAERVTYAKTIQESARRLSNLISNILKLNKLENQRIQPEFSSYDLVGQLSDCVIQFEALWDQKDIEMEADMEDRVLYSGDNSLMAVVWNNLLSNAIKFTDSGGRIAIKQVSTENAITVSISDSGCGMDEETRRHVFDKFYQGDSSHSKEGNGLGLALALRVLQLHNGHIEVSSRVGEGTTFTVVLPLMTQARREGERR